MKNLVKKKLNLIALMDLISGALAMHGIRVIAKFNGMTQKKASFESTI